MSNNRQGIMNKILEAQGISIGLKSMFNQRNRNIVFGMDNAVLTVDQNSLQNLKSSLFLIKNFIFEEVQSYNIDYTVSTFKEYLSRGQLEIEKYIIKKLKRNTSHEIRNDIHIELKTLDLFLIQDRNIFLWSEVNQV